MSGVFATGYPGRLGVRGGALAVPRRDPSVHARGRRDLTRPGAEWGHGHESADTARVEVDPHGPVGDEALERAPCAAVLAVVVSVASGGVDAGEGRRAVLARVVVGVERHADERACLGAAVVQ